MRNIVYFFLASMISLPILAQQKGDSLSGKQDLQEVVILGVKARDKHPVTFSNLSKKEIEKQNFGQDLPFILNLTPSTVVNSDAGAGVGYTAIRIRGTDPSRTNVTVNGVPVNDAESHGTFWVDFPDLASSSQGIQVQRGVGTSGNGAGAFGASINLQTDGLHPNAYAEASGGYGSFNTRKSTVKFGTGLLANGWSLDGRLSKISSDGFIDRATSDLKSFFLSAAYYGTKDILKINVFSGKEQTYQAWNGIPESRIKGDVAGMQTLATIMKMSQDERDNLLNSDNRTYNPFTYPNQTDNYQQDYYQLFYTRGFATNWKANIGLHYTYGRGYYEEYRAREQFSTYKLKDTLFSGTDTITKGDFIRRRWLDNDFYGIIFSVVHEHERVQLTFGGAINRYEGRQYGELIWAAYSQGSMPGQHFYDGQSDKIDISYYGKLSYDLTDKLQGFVDMQHRIIRYSLKGEDLNSGYYFPYDFQLNYQFFNPKAGLTYSINRQTNIYAYAGIANKEPVRSDIIQASATSLPKSERLINYELGYRKTWEKSALTINGYLMDYTNQLVTTGQINDVGAYNRVNVASSYRAGIEVTGGVSIWKGLRWQATATWSRNKISAFTEYMDDWDNGGQVQIQHTHTDIAFSPDWVASSLLSYTPVKGLDIDFISKYVGKEYLDNTQNKGRMLDAFFVNDLRAGYTVAVPGWFREVRIGILVNNLTNAAYAPNGYTFSALYGGMRNDFNYYYPQAGTHFLSNLTLKF